MIDTVTEMAKPTRGSMMRSMAKGSVSRAKRRLKTISQNSVKKMKRVRVRGRVRVKVRIRVVG